MPTLDGQGQPVFYRSICRFTLVVCLVTIKLSLLSGFDSRFLATPSNFLLQTYVPKNMNNWAYQMQWQSKQSFTSHEYLMYQISIVINLEKLNVSGIVLSLSAFVKVIIINSATATVIFSFIPPQIPTVCLHAKSLQSCMTLCNPIDHSPPGSYVHGILLARILEWVAMPSSRESSWHRDRTCISQVTCIGRQALYH